MGKSSSLTACVALFAACSSAGGGGDGGGDLAGLDFSGADFAHANSDLAGAGGASVLQHHNSATRDGLYVDPLITKAAAATMHVDTTFNAVTSAQVYAQLLYVDGGPGGTDLVIAATQKNDVFAFNAATGAVVWHTGASVIGTPATASALPCGNIAPTLGITGTPAIDLATRDIFFSAETETAGGGTYKEMIWALSLDDGTPRAGWPVDVSAKFPPFDSSVQNGRGAVAVVNGTLYAPFGGMAGDCGTYHGYVIGVPINNPGAAVEWHNSAPQGGIWAPSGVSSDGASIFAATGNSIGGAAFGDQESIIRFGAGPTFSGNNTDIFTASDWQALDSGDIDISGTGPIVFDFPGATPTHLVAGLGKDGKAYLLDHANFGGLGGSLTATQVSSGEIINAAAAYTTANGTYIAFKGAGSSCPAGQGGGLTAIKLAATSPITIQSTAAWCTDQGGAGSPMVTTTDGRADAIVWALGAEGDNRLHGFDADSGAVVFGGGGAGDVMNTIRRFSTPIAAKGRIFVAADDKLYAFKP